MPETLEQRRLAAWRAYWEPRERYLQDRGEDFANWLELAFIAGWEAAQQDCSDQQ